MKTVLETESTIFTGSGRQFLVVEAKGNPDFAPLDSHLPQVVAQCLAM